MSKIIVKTPRGCVVEQRSKGGKVSTRIEWDPQFGPEWTERLNTAQTRFDVECLRLCDKYVAMDTGATKNSAQIASNIGEGELIWNTPYAGSIYRSKRKPGGMHGALRGPQWGDRMKADNLQHLAAFLRKQVDND